MSKATPAALLRKLTSLGQASSAKDIDCIICDLTGETRRLHFEESDLSSEIPRLLLIVLDGSARCSQEKQMKDDIPYCSSDT